MDKKYQVIYADPPWRYTFSKSNSREIENHYPTMTIDEIASLIIPAEDNAVLFMWTTAPKLEESFKILKSWGFQYKSCMVWDKELLGMGYWFRGQHEILLVGTRGKFSPPPQPLRIGSVFREKRTKHSKKPTAIRDLIASWYPKTTKLEMFSRQKTNGWDIWGNELPNDIEIKEVLKNGV